MTEAIGVASKAGPQAGAKQGEAEKLLALYAEAKASPETELSATAETEKLTFGMINETARWLKDGPKAEEWLARRPEVVGPRHPLSRGFVRDAERVQKWWLHEIGKARGEEEAEDFRRAWKEAFERAGVVPEAAKPGFAENLEAAIAKQASLKNPGIQPKAEPVALPVAEVEQSKALTIIEPSKETVPANETPEERAVREMNDKHAVISNLGGKCVIMEWVPSAISAGQKELSYQSFQAFRERYANQYVAVPNGRGRWETAPAAPFWLAHPHRRQYEGLDLVPGGPPILPNGYLNLWKGWGVEPRKGSWRLMERHIAEVLANGSQTFEDFIKRSTAWKFQNPGLPPEVLLALLGGKGVGKGAWGYIQMLIYGTHGLQIFSTEHLTGKHNQHLQDKLFLFLDEAIWAGDRQADRILKGLTTEKAMFIEPKNVNGFQWPNRLGMYMSGNDKWIVPASHDERRYAVNKVSERWKQNKAYFGPLFEEINNGGAGAMLYDLLSLDLDGWHPRDNVPQTKALLDQKMLGLDGLELWYVHLLNVGQLPAPDKKNPRRVVSGRLLEDAKNHNARNKYLNFEVMTGFLKEMGCTHKSDGKAQVKLPRLRGHPNIGVFGVHNGKKARTLCAGIPSADDRAGSSRSHAGRIGEGVRAVGAGNPQLGCTGRP